jgi:pimeloyl-ACP methyl ester carboxylesterase
MTQIQNGPISWIEANDAGAAMQGTIIFLHAMAGSATAWAPQMAEFSSHYRCIAWDMLGFGESEDAGREVKMSDVVACLEAFVTQELGLKSAHFVGLSVGGMLLQHFAAAHPNLTDSIVILDSSPKFAFGSDASPEEFADPILATLLDGVTPAEFSDGMIRAIVGPTCSENTKLECIAAMSRAKISGLALTTRLIANHDALDVLEKISCPTLVMAGFDDGETPPDYAYEIARRIPKASVTIIPNAGHIVNLENPEAVNERLRFFLERSL